MTALYPLLEPLLEAHLPDHPFLRSHITWTIGLSIFVCNTLAFDQPAIFD